MSERTVIVGNGPAGHRLAERLRARGTEHAVTVLGEEPEPAYNRVLLSSVLAGSLPALLAAQFALGVANRLSQVSSTLAGTHGPVAARSEGTASALLTATRQCGSAVGVAIVSATLVAVSGSIAHRTAVAMFVAAGFAQESLVDEMLADLRAQRG